MSESKRWIFVIDTDQYTGNFEREMCAYCTGVIGDSEVGKEYAKMFETLFGEENIFDNILQACSIWRSSKNMNDKQLYNSIAIFFQNKPTDDDICVIKYRANEFIKLGYINTLMHIPDDIKILNFRLIEEITTISEIYHKI